MEPVDVSSTIRDTAQEESATLRYYFACIAYLDASAFRVIGIAQENDGIRVTWMTGIGKTNTLQATSGDESGGFTNAFTDLFVITNTVGSVTNYLDIGGATNTPSRFYRIRLVP